MATAAAPTALTVPTSAIDRGENVREIDWDHVRSLASSIALIGILAPLNVKPLVGERFLLVAGNHRYEAAMMLGLEEVPVTFRERERVSADTAAENVVRKQLNSLQKARAVGAMLAEGFTLDGAAEALGWTRKLTKSYAEVLEMPAAAQALVGTGQLPMAVPPTINDLSRRGRALCDDVVTAIAAGDLSANDIVRNPSWALHSIVYHRCLNADGFAAFLNDIDSPEVKALRLGKKATAALEEAHDLSRRLDGPWARLTVRFTDVEADQARAAGVLFEPGRGARVILDRDLYRELCRQAIAHTLEETRERQREHVATRASSRRQAGEETPAQLLQREHNATMRDLARQAHGVNLDLGAALVRELSVVDPESLDIARFFAYGLLGPDRPTYLGKEDHRVRAIAANGIRLVIEEHRTTTPTLKNGKPGKAKVAYGDVADASAWLWRYVSGARTAGELYGRVLIVFAAQHHATQLVLARSARRSSVAPSSHNDIAAKAFAKLTGKALPATHRHLQRAIARAARDHDARAAAIEQAASTVAEDRPEADPLEDDCADLAA